jgi:hypothetical protein
MFEYDFQLSERRIQHMDGYNHTMDTYQMDVTTYGVKDLSEPFKNKIVRIIQAMHNTYGIGSSHVQSPVGYEGLVSMVAKPNPYNAEKPYEYGVYRFTYVVRTSGTD